ncbi:hypothetical protein ACTMTI_50405 [Nonomuraea sp. H19]|uniref:hypothetical protein n=1 Tax=Nonomuraea sp. H19 TaxID=3452206 RepID=UPI003F894DFF
MVTHYFRDRKALLAHARSLMHHRMADRVEALAAQSTVHERLRSACEQALPLDDERRLGTVVWARRHPGPALTWFSSCCVRATR